MKKKAPEDAGVSGAFAFEQKKEHPYFLVFNAKIINYTCEYRKEPMKVMLTVMEAPIRLKRTWGNVGEIADLREKALAAFLKKLKLQEGENLLRVVLFGSVARGDSRPDSDIDLFVLVKEGTNMELTRRIISISVDADMEEGECKVHITPFINTLKEYQEGRAIGVPVFDNIEEEGVVLYDIER